MPPHPTIATRYFGETIGTWLAVPLNLSIYSKISVNLGLHPPCGETVKARATS